MLLSGSGEHMAAVSSKVEAVCTSRRNLNYHILTFTAVI